MTPLNILKSILDNEYESEDGDLYKNRLYKGLSDAEILDFKKKLPNQYLPKDIEDLLKFSRGFDFSPLQEIKFDAFNSFGFEEAFPFSILLAGDGFGNFWIVDIDSKGNWNEIFYVCHDPPVIVKQAKNLAQFFYQIDEFGKKERDSFISKVHDEIVIKIWEGDNTNIYKDYPVENLPISTKNKIPSQFLVADLKNKDLGEGFNWGINGPNPNIEKLADTALWIIDDSLNYKTEKRAESSQGFLNWFKNLWKR